MAIHTVNPATGETVTEYEPMSVGTVDQILTDTLRSYQEWSRVPMSDRARPMQRAAEILRERADTYARLMAEEMGKPLGQGRAEIEKCAWVCEYYAQNAATFLAPQPRPIEHTRSFVTFRPLGPVLAVMPWNFPFWQVFRFIAPNLMAGNAGLLKHASNVQGSALAIEDVLRGAGFPPDLFRTLVIGSDRVAEIIRRPEVRAVTLTGSTPAGRAVASTAGSVLKKTVLELGGSDAYVILEDADLERAITHCVTSRTLNTGQSCIAAKRFVVVEKVRDAFTEGFVDAMRAKSVGAPLDAEEEVDLGPLARADLRDELHDQVNRSVAAGARLLLGGDVPRGSGAFYPPTVLTDVVAGMPAYAEETFGPVAAILPARDEEDAIRIANDSSFGLGAAVFTRDLNRGERIAAERLEAGACFVNDFVKSDPRLPFGGIKESGYGRELAGFGIREFVNIKTVWID